MMAILQLPSQFAKITGCTTATLHADSVLALITLLVQYYPSLSDYLLTPSQQLTPFINIYVNQQDIRHLDGENTRLTSKDEVTLVPALAGG